MKYAEGTRKLNALREKIAAIRKQMQAVQADLAHEPVEDYVFQTPEGETKLSKLFGRRDDLIVIHNMGRSCAYCTLWADGYNGVYPHLADRAAFVVSSPDSPADQKTFAQSRGWRFPMVSHAKSSFARDMGYMDEDGNSLPGVSVFKRAGGRLVRVSDTSFGPGDAFCSVWHFLDLLPGGAGDWSPKLKYK